MGRSKLKISKKGIAKTMVAIVGGLILIGLLVVIAYFFFINYVDVHEILQEGAVERHAINLGQAVIAYPGLVYQDDNFLYRGIFERGKIQQQFTSLRDDEWANTPLTDDIGYPNSVIILGIKDFETGDEWSIKYRGPQVEQESAAAAYIRCLSGQDDRVQEYTDIEHGEIFKNRRIWDLYDFWECGEITKSNFGTATRTFSILIKDGDELHTGALYVSVKEAWNLLRILGTEGAGAR